MLAKIALGFLITTGFGTAYILQDGFVHVTVEDYAENGTHLHLYIPAELAPIAAHFVPNGKMDRDVREFQEMLPVIRSAAAELNRLPDSVLVEIHHGEDYVRVAKAGHGLDVQKDSPNEHVHVWVPLRTIYDTADVFASRFGAN